jgi:hypothetical protein
LLFQEHPAAGGAMGKRIALTIGVMFSMVFGMGTQPMALAADGAQVTHHSPG